MANIAEYISPRTSVKQPAYSYSGPLLAPQPCDDTRIRGFRLILIWLAAILFSWALAGTLIYGGFKIVSFLLS